MTNSNTYRISIVSDKDSWINDFLQKLTDEIESLGHSLFWIHNVEDIKSGDFCFLLGCSQIMSEQIMNRNIKNFVVHESNLPEGKGWSPLSWQLLNGHSKVVTSLIEVAKQVDSGAIMLQEEIIFNGHELVNEIREIQARHTFSLCLKFLKNKNAKNFTGNKQKGKESFYKRRLPMDSRLDPEKSISEQFNLLRIVDNNRYPAFFDLFNNRYKILIEKIKK